jgi:hypothetical protein
MGAEVHTLDSSADSPRSWGVRHPGLFPIEALLIRGLTFATNRCRIDTAPHSSSARPARVITVCQAPERIASLIEQQRLPSIKRARHAPRQFSGADGALVAGQREHEFHCCTRGSGSGYFDGAARCGGNFPDQGEADSEASFA